MRIAISITIGDAVPESVCASRMYMNVCEVCGVVTGVSRCRWRALCVAARARGAIAAARARQSGAGARRAGKEIQDGETS